MSRYAIRAANGLFYSGNDVTRTVPVPRKDDPTRNDMISKLAPVFAGANIDQALKYGTKADAETIFTHPDLEDAAAFAGAEIVQCEFDTDDMSAVRPV